MILVKKKARTIHRKQIDNRSFLDENETAKIHIEQQEYESQLVHNIILNLLKRRYELHTVHEKKDKVCLMN